MLIEKYKFQTDLLRSLVQDITDAIAEDDWVLAECDLDVLRWRAEELYEQIKEERE